MIVWRKLRLLWGTSSWLLPKRMLAVPGANRQDWEGGLDDCWGKDWNSLVATRGSQVQITEANNPQNKPIHKPKPHVRYLALKDVSNLVYLSCFQLPFLSYPEFLSLPDYSSEFWSNWRIWLRRIISTEWGGGMGDALGKDVNGIGQDKTLEATHKRIILFKTSFELFYFWNCSRWIWFSFTFQIPKNESKLPGKGDDLKIWNRTKKRAI